MSLNPSTGFPSSLLALLILPGPDDEINALSSIF